jgi:hypothetical protein
MSQRIRVNQAFEARTRFASGIGLTEGNVYRNGLRRPDSMINYGLAGRATLDASKSVGQQPRARRFDCNRESGFKHLRFR